MSRLLQIGRWSMLALLLLSMPAAAQSLSQIDLRLSPAGQQRAIPVFSVGAPQARTIGLDYAVFATELLAYVTKEVLPDSSDEYRKSLIHSQLTDHMPEHRSEFGSHCLEIVMQMGSALPAFHGGSAVMEPSLVDYAVRTASAALALRQIWSAFQNNVEGGSNGLSLNPKVSARRFGVNLTLHW